MAQARARVEPSCEPRTVGRGDSQSRRLVHRRGCVVFVAKSIGAMELVDPDSHFAIGIDNLSAIFLIPMLLISARGVDLRPGILDANPPPQ